RLALGRGQDIRLTGAASETIVETSDEPPRFRFGYRPKSRDHVARAGHLECLTQGGDAISRGLAEHCIAAAQANELRPAEVEADDFLARENSILIIWPGGRTFVVAGKD